LLIFARINKSLKQENIDNNLFGEVLDVRMSIDVVFLSNFVLEEVPRIIFTQALHLDTLTPHVIADLVVPRREDDFLPAPKWRWQAECRKIKPLSHIIKEQQEWLAFQTSGDSRDIWQRRQ